MNALVKEKTEEPEASTSGSSEFDNEIIRDYWEWAPSATCRTLDPNVYESREKIPLAKFLCDGCPVKRDCLVYALTYNEYGIWGGTTKGERDRNYSKNDRNVLIRQTQLQGLYYSRTSPGALIRQFLEQQEEQ